MARNDRATLDEKSTLRPMTYELGTADCRVLIRSKEQIEAMLVDLQDLRRVF